MAIAVWMCDVSPPAYNIKRTAHTLQSVHDFCADWNYIHVYDEYRNGRKNRHWDQWCMLSPFDWQRHNFVFRRYLGDFIGFAFPCVLLIAACHQTCSTGLRVPLLGWDLTAHMHHRIPTTSKRGIRVTWRALLGQSVPSVVAEHQYTFPVYRFSDIPFILCFGIHVPTSGVCF